MSIYASKQGRTREDIFRESLLRDLPEFHYAQSMILMKSIAKHPLKWGVVYEGKTALSAKIWNALQSLGGIGGTW